MADAEKKTTTPVPDRYLSPASAGRLIDVREPTIRAWVRDGRLPGVKVGRLVRIPLSALMELVRS